MKRRDSVAMVVCAGLLWAGTMCVPAGAQEQAAEKSAAVEAPRHLDGAWVQCVMSGAQGVLSIVRQTGKMLSCVYEGVCVVRTRREGSENKVVSVNIYMP